MCVLLSAVGRLEAQDAQTATVGGTVIDQSGRAIPDAAVALKNQANDVVRSGATDPEGRYSLGNVPPGTYKFEVAAPGFGSSIRDLDLAAGGSQDLPITLSVASQSQTVTVEGVISLAAQLAPSGNTLDATSAKTEISGEYIQNFISPIADFAEVVQMAPGTFSINPNGVGLALFP